MRDILGRATVIGDLIMPVKASPFRRYQIVNFCARHDRPHWAAALRCAVSTFS